MGIFLVICGYLIEKKNGYIGCWKLLSMPRINRIYVQCLKLCFDAIQINYEFSLMFVVIKVKKNYYVDC